MVDVSICADKFNLLLDTRHPTFATLLLAIFVHIDVFMSPVKERSEGSAIARSLTYSTLLLAVL